MKKLLSIIYFSCSMTSMYCMHNMALVHAARQDATSESEQTSLLAHNFSTESEEPSSQITRLTDLLSQKERELRLLQERFPSVLEKLHRERRHAHITSNEITGWIATGFYGGNTCMQTSIINRPEIWSSLKFSVTNSFVSTWCSLAYVMILEECKKCIN